MEKSNLAVQAFRLENKKIMLDNLPKELYDNIQEQMPEFYEKIDAKAWVSEIISPDGIKFYVVMSRNSEAVKEFMHTILYAEEILNA